MKRRPWPAFGALVGSAACLALAAEPEGLASEGGERALGSTPATATDVVVTVGGVRPKKEGTIIVSIYRDRESWLDPEGAAHRTTVAPDADSVVVRFESVPAGTVGVAAIHDTNGNGRVDMRWFPIPKPKEGVGVSNDVTRLGPPQWEKARVELGAPETRVRFDLRY